MIRKTILGLLAAFAAVTTVSCDDLIYESEGDCNPVHIVRFVYDYNMKFSDAFPAEVPSVNLYVFDRSGNLVSEYSHTVNSVTAKDFSIDISDLPAGNYDLLAWCGVKDSEHLNVNPLLVANPLASDHTCRVSREEAAETGHVRKDIGRLYHGRLENVELTSDEGEHVHYISLIKDTNVVRVVLQHLSGEPMNADDYDITINEVNGHLDHTNSLLDDGDLQYHPWLLRGGFAEFHPEDDPSGRSASRAQTSVSAVVSEFTVNRLMADHDANLTVRDKDGGLILSIPLTQYLLMVRGYYYGPDGHTPMTDQEYLDRQDEYPVTFFLDSANRWINTVIYINSWRVVLNNTPIH